MEPLKNLLPSKEKRPRSDGLRSGSRPSTPTMNPPNTPTLPACEVCGDEGIVTLDVPLDDPRFGKAVPCPNPDCAVGREKALRRIQAVFKRSNIGERYLRFRLKDFAAGYPKAHAAARALLNNGGFETPVGFKRGLWLYGPTGTGKTTLAVAITREYMRAGYDVLFAFVPDLLDDIRAAYRDQQSQANADDYTRDPLEMARRVPLLVLDDLGAQRDTDWAVETLGKLINYREANDLSTIVTSNESPEALLNRAGNAEGYTLQRIVSRLAGMTLPILMDGEDKRIGG